MKGDKTIFTTVSYSKDKAEKLEKICQKIGLSKAQFIDAAIELFYKTGDDPRQTINESTTVQISKFQNKMVGFLRTQEKEYLDPIAKKIQVIEEEVERAKRYAKLNFDILRPAEPKQQNQIQILASNQEVIKNKIDENKKEQDVSGTALYSHVSNIQKAVELTANKKKKALEEINQLKSKTVGGISKEEVLTIIANM